jgi:chromosome segregation ATPase
MSNHGDFQKDNAFILSKFEEVAGLLEHLKSQNRSLRNQVIGLEFEKENQYKEIQNLKKTNQLLKNDIKELQDNVVKENILIPQNFKIKNKIIKIVSDIKENEVEVSELKNLVALLIEELDSCIHQLEK